MTPPPHRRLVGIAGLLLTPLVAWAASFLGGWIGAIIGGMIPNPRVALFVTFLGSLTTAVAASFVWLRVIARWRARHPKDSRE